MNSRFLISPTYISFLLVAFISGIAGALQFPTLSLFLTSEVKVRPLWVGLFYTVNAFVGIMVSFLLAKRSDQQGDRRKLIILCCVMAIANSVLFAFVRHYVVLITLGVFLAALANTAMPQIFALAREYADYSAQDVVMFSAIMRAQLSLAWVIGPPLSFILALNYSFTFMYLTGAAMFCLVTLLVIVRLPSVPRPINDENSNPQAPIFADRNVLLLFIASVLMWCCNLMYLIDMPLYITQHLGLSERLAGVLMGIAAGLEIPVMLLAGRYVRRFGKRKIMLFALVAGMLFYSGLVGLTFEWALIILQLFNAIFIGIIASIGMLYFQDLMPGRMGSATTLFTNSISTGVILAGVLQGLFSETWGHNAVYLAALFLIVLSLLLCAKVKDV